MARSAARTMPRSRTEPCARSSAHVVGRDAGARRSGLPLAESVSRLDAFSLAKMACASPSTTPRHRRARCSTMCSPRCSTRSRQCAPSFASGCASAARPSQRAPRAAISLRGVVGHAHPTANPSSTGSTYLHGASSRSFRSMRNARACDALLPIRAMPSSAEASWSSRGTRRFIYKRVLISELIERCGIDHHVVRAVRDRAVCMVKPFACKLLHKRPASPC